MEITLVTSSNFIKNETPDKILAKSFDCNSFNRCELALRSSKGISAVNDYEYLIKLNNCIQIARSNNVAIIFSIAAHRDALNRNEQICVYEAEINGRKKILSRYCPNRQTIIDNFNAFITDASKQILFSNKDQFLISYYRHENFGQCVCDYCIDNFTYFLKQKAIGFKFNNINDLLNDKIIFEWVSWRQNNMANNLKSIANMLPGESLIEIDYDASKRYLTGPYIEEGLNPIKLLKHISELYLHIEPTGHPKSPRGDEGYIRSLRYINSIITKHNVLLTPLFSPGNLLEDIKKNLPEVVIFSRLVGFKNIALYTEEPLSLARQIKSQYIL